jgi:REP element-mobilizing transposase RayT
VHVTMRARDDAPSLRSPTIFAALVAALNAASKANFRVIQFTAQRDHLHLIVEADDKVALTCGLNGLAVRCTRAINRAARRRGSVWADRYHSAPKETPTAVRRVIVYVLFNSKKHAPASAAALDPCSSAPWFDRFQEFIPRPSTPSPVRAPRTWLAREGWLKGGGPISIHAAPAPA